MYPPLVLIIVNKECSIVDTFGFSTGHANSAEHSSATIGQLVFATKSTVDNEQSLFPRHSSFPGGPGSSDSHLA